MTIRIVSPETRQKMSESAKKRRHSEETKAKIGKAHKGKIISEEQRRNHSVAMKANHPKPMLGRRHNVESIEKLKRSIIGRTRTPEQEEARITALKKAVIGRKQSPEAKDKIRQAVQERITRQGPNWKYKNTKGEVMAAEFLTNQGLEFKQNFLFSKHLYDFYVPALNLIIEVDGSHHWDIPWFEPDVSKHSMLLEAQKERDLQQTKNAEEAGFKVIRIFCKNAPGDSYHGSLDEQLTRQGFVR